MSIWGKLVGGTTGFALGGPLGALLGTVAGHVVDRWREEQQPKDGEDAMKSIAFTIGVIALGAKMAKADGAVCPVEEEAFRRVFQVPAEEERNVDRIFNLAKRDTAGFESYARQLAGMFRDRRGVLEELLDALFHIAMADGVLHEGELAYLRRVAAIFGFDDAEFERIRAANGAPDREDPYHVLEVDRDAPDEALKATYRRLALEHHPDRLIAEGMPAEFVRIANDKLAAINAAWERIERERGLK